MKNITYLVAILFFFGLSINAQNVAISDKSTSLTWTQDTALQNSLIIGSNSVNSAGATAANQNTALGIQALDNLKQGDNNTAVGYNAGSAVGGAAGSGSGNTLIGRAAGYQIGAGSYNTIVGNQAGTVLVGGEYNTFLGSGAKGNLGGGDHRIGIGQGVEVTSDNTGVIGKSTMTDFYFGGMGTGEWNSNLYANSIYLANSDQISNASAGTIVFSGNITVSSDMRLKDNIQPLGSTMLDILKLDGKSYTRDGREEIGLLAQDVQLVYPELVSEDENGMLSVNYQALSAILINGIKDQEARIQKLELLVKLLLEDK